MSSWARVGMKVVCIADEVGRLDDMGFPSFLKGQILTISEIVSYDDYGIFLAFSERDRKNLGHINGFRPLITKTQSEDVAIFAPLLNTKARESVE